MFQILFHIRNGFDVYGVEKRMGLESPVKPRVYTEVNSKDVLC